MEACWFRNDASQLPKQLNVNKNSSSVSQLNQSAPQNKNVKYRLRMSNLFVLFQFCNSFLLHFKMEEDIQKQIWNFNERLGGILLQSKIYFLYFQNHSCSVEHNQPFLS